jgi:outer membrane lipoprotein-sorting protein
MRWDYEVPERKTAIVRDGATLLYLEVERQAIEGTLEQGGGVLLALLAGDRPLTKLFAEAPAREDDPVAPRGADIVRLRPLDADGTFESVALVVRRKTGAILAARVRDSAGNVMDYTFPDLRRNVDLPRETFEFRVPDGTEMLAGG